MNLHASQAWLVRSRARILATGSLLLAVAAAHGQTPVTGYDICDDGSCSTPVDNVAARASLFGFKLQGGRLDAPSDVLLDEQHSGGITTGLAYCSTVGWLLPSNWRIAEQPADDVVAVVVGPDWVAWDSGNIQDTLGDFSLSAFLQVPGALAGHLSPLVEPLAPSGATVRWTPLQEVDDARLGPTDCRRAGATDRGFVVGYNVYRLPVASFPRPTLRDFATRGFAGFADLRRLRFDVPDPDGFSGSDLDELDGLRLVNPDGQPDTGDEILAWTDAAGAPPSYWYRVQPVVHGQQDTPDIGGTSVPVQRLDLDGDGALDSVDIGADGFLEFIDPSRQGLGLTYAGEILSSPLPGTIGAVPGGHAPCGTAGAHEASCSDGIDEDGDGLVDCADPDCAGNPACVAAPQAVECSRITPPRGPASGGQLVLVEGRGMSHVVGVTVDGQAVEFRVSGDRVLHFRSVRHAPGTVDVELTGDDGGTCTLPYTYVGSRPRRH